MMTLLEKMLSFLNSRVFIFAGQKPADGREGIEDTEVKYESTGIVRFVFKSIKVEIKEGIQ